MKYTPAPWNVRVSEDYYSCYHIGDPDYEISKEEDRANVRLIAKAPEMYKILKDINVKYPMYVEGLDKLLKEIENERIT